MKQMKQNNNIVDEQSNNNPNPNDSYIYYYEREQLDPNNKIQILENQLKQKDNSHMKQILTL